MSKVRNKVAVGLSGGVDSAVAAYLLKAQGYEVTGVHMQCWDYSTETCKGNEDRSDAVAVCGQLGVKFEFLNFENEYKIRVIDYFYSEYRAGRTPNPDVLCNKEIKFGLFMDWALAQGFDYVATGHYARIKQNGRKFFLLKGVDESKDQSYFLYRLDQNQLSRILFPLGDLKKVQVRQIAREQKLVVAEKPESMGICFVGEVDINKFLKKKIEPKEGDVILKSSGEVIGRHEGVWFYTIGQRHGFKISKYVGLPLYVVGKDVEQNILFVGYYNDCLTNRFELENPHFIAGEPQFEVESSGEQIEPVLSNRFKCEIRIRHLGQLYNATVTKSPSDEWIVNLDEAAFGVAPGQSAVFYRGNEILGGGIIK